MSQDNKKLTPFEESIKSYLEQRAANDESFAERYQKPSKNIQECCRHIIHSVQKTGRHGFTDEEIYGMAVHYYDEDDIKVPTSTPGVSVVINKDVPLTDEEKNELKAKAKADFLKKQEELLAKQEAEKAARQKRTEERRKKAAEERLRKVQELQGDLFAGGW